MTAFPSYTNYDGNGPFVEQLWLIYDIQSHLVTQNTYLKSHVFETKKRIDYLEKVIVPGLLMTLSNMNQQLYFLNAQSLQPSDIMVAAASLSHLSLEETSNIDTTVSK